MNDNLIERKAFADFLLGNYSDVYTQENVDHYIEHNHVSWLAWQARAAIECKSVPHTVVAGALFDFMGFLTSQKECYVFSASDDASPAVEAIQTFSAKRGLSLDDAKVREWIDCLAAPQPQPVQEPVAWYDGKNFYENPESASMCMAEMTNLHPLYTSPQIQGEKQ